MLVDLHSRFLRNETRVEGEEEDEDEEDDDRRDCTMNKGFSVKEDISKNHLEFYGFLMIYMCVCVFFG